MCDQAGNTYVVDLDDSVVCISCFSCDGPNWRSILNINISGLEHIFEIPPSAAVSCLAVAVKVPREF